MQFPVKPEFFDLNELECRLLAPRLPFKKLMQAPRGRQFKIHGNVVNVPAEVSDTVNMLPRLPSETGTIKVNLKRRLQYKSSALSLSVRPYKVVQAANWLISNSSLYRQEGITLNQNEGMQCIDNCLIDDSNIKDKNQLLLQNVDKSGSCNTQTDTALMQILNLYCSEFSIFIGDFNVNWLNQKDKTHLHNLFITDNNYRQLVSCYTTDNRTTIDHIYTNLPEPEVTVHVLETYFSDHKAICALIQTKIA